MSELNARLLNEIVDGGQGNRPQERAVGSPPRRLPHRRHREGQRPASPSKSCGSWPTTAGNPSPSTSTAPAATSPMGWRSTTSSATSSAPASRSPSSCRGWPTRWARSYFRRPVQGKRLAYPHSWIMIHEPAKWAGWQSTTAAAQHLDRLKQMQSQIYRIMADRSGKPLRQIIRDTKRVDFYLDAWKAKEYGLIDAGRSARRSRPSATRRSPQPRSPPAGTRAAGGRCQIHGRSES